jgi:KaiC/GvpD/RAD55 family RecA-like ATPase
VPAIRSISNMSHHNSLAQRDRLAWLASGRTHVLVGGPGTGKTELCLRFIGAGLAVGERAAMVVLSRGSDVKAQASRLGIKLDDALRDGRLVLLRYRADFADQSARAASPSAVVDELERLIAPMQPTRIVIDSFGPLLGDGPAAAGAIAALSAFLDRSGATSLLTYPEDVSNGYDRRLEPLMQGAAAIIRLDRRSRDRIDLRTLTTRGLESPAAASDHVVAIGALPS